MALVKGREPTMPRGRGRRRRSLPRVFLNTAPLLFAVYVFFGSCWPPTGPGPFTGSAAAIGPDSISVAWRASISYSGGTIAYDVSLDGMRAVTGGTDLAFTAGSLLPGTTHTVGVTARNKDGEASIEIAVTTLPAGYGTVSNKTVVSGGRTREYSVYLPSGIEAGTTVPLVIHFHGSGGVAREEIAAGYAIGLAQREKFIFCQPQALPFVVPSEPNAEWNVQMDGRPWDDLLFTSDVIDAVQAEYPVDHARVFISGMSSGGFMAYYAGERLIDRVAAVAPIAGGLDLRVFDAYPMSRPLPLLTIHGTADSLVSYAGMLPVIDRWKAGNGCTSQAVTQLPDIDPSDGSTVTVIHYFGPDPDSDVFLYRVNGGGHGVPGIEAGYNQDINSWEVIWSFLKSHTNPDPR